MSGRAAGSATSRGVRAALLCSTLAFAVTQGLAVPGIGAVAADFGVSVSMATWVLTANLAVTAVSISLIGRLGDMFGRQRLLLLTLSVVIVGGAVAAVAPSLGVMVAGRALQGVGGGVFALCFGLAREYLPLPARRRAIGMLGAAAGVGGAVGLPLGGLLMDMGGYRWLYWAGAAFCLVALLMVMAWVPQSGAVMPSRVDLPGALGLVVVVALPLVAVGRANTVGWADPRTVLAFVCAVLVLAVLVPIERRARPPLIDIASARSRQLAIPNVATAVMGAASFAVLVLVPQFALSPDGPGASATVSGLLMLPASFGTLVAGSIAGRVTARYGSRTVLLLGTGVTTAGMALLAFMHTGLLALMVGSLVVYVGLGFALAAFANLVVDAVPLSRTGEFTGVNGLFRIAGSALGAQVAVALATSDTATEVASGGLAIAFGGLAVLMALTTGLTVLLPASEPVARFG
jgi:MFS family permease